MREIKKFWCQYCLEKTPHSLIAITLVERPHISKTFIDYFFKRNTAYHWECTKCGEKIRRWRRK